MIISEDNSAPLSSPSASRSCCLLGPVVSDRPLEVDSALEFLQVFFLQEEREEKKGSESEC